MIKKICAICFQEPADGTYHVLGPVSCVAELTQPEASFHYRPNGLKGNEKKYDGPEILNEEYVKVIKITRVKS